MDEQVELPKQNSPIVPVVLAVMITALVVGGGMYWWQMSQGGDDSRVEAMNKEFEAMKKKVEAIIQDPKKLERNMAFAEPALETSDSTMVSFDTMAEYERYVGKSEEAQNFKSSAQPSGFVRVKSGGKDLSIAPEGVDFFNAFVWARADWDAGELEDIQRFYIETVRSTPGTSESEDEHAWFGPFEGKLKLLIQ